MIDYDKVMNWDFGVVEQTYTAKDSILYALGLGYGADPLQSEQLQFTFEEAQGFTAVPTMAVVLGTPGFWARDPDTGIDWKKILHGEQGLTLHAPLPATATVRAETHVTEIIDKGQKGAFIYSERDVYNQADGQKLATLSATTVARGDGGFGGPTASSRPVHRLPAREADQTCDLPTLPQAALIYRLSGDPNPLHAAPEVATAAGFDAPILHGLCTLGVAGHALLRCCCDYDPARLKAMQLRFSAPVYPGETIRTEIWRDGNDVWFRATVVERDRVVLNNGHATLA